MKIIRSSLETTILPFVATLAAWSVAAPVARGQAVVYERDKVAMVGGSGADAFGEAVAVRGDHLFVGAPLADSLAPDAGVVQWFAYGTPPTFVANLYGSDLSGGDAFGATLVAANDRVAIGAPSHTHAVVRGGAVYVFAWNGTSWLQEAELLAPDAVTDDGFGASIDMAGDLVVVGASSATVGGNAREGAAYVFERVAGVWTFVQKLATPDHAVEEQFGFSVGVGGELIAVASYYGDGGYPLGLGAVHVFRRVAGTYVHEARLTQPAGPSPYGTFGHALDVSGDCVAVGHPYGVAPSGSGTGLVHVFRSTAGMWLAEATLAPVGGYSNGGQTGRALQISGDRIVAGALWYSPYGFSSGGVYVFERSGPTWVSWNMPLVLIPKPGASGQFGRAVSVDGDRAWIANSSHAHTYLLPHRVGDEFCFGDGLGTPCPCGNTSSSVARAGCANDSFGRGAALTATGTLSASNDDLVFSVLGTGNAQEPMILFVGNQRLAGGAGVAFGDGLRCVGAYARRYPVQIASSNFGIAVYGPGLVAYGGLPSGSTRYFQAFYRSNSGPCGTGFNLTNAVAITLKP